MRNKNIATGGEPVATERQSSGGDLSDLSIPSLPSSPQTPLEPIEILDFQRLDGRGAVKAVCRVRYGPIVIAGVKVVLPVLASRPFVAMPSRKLDDEWEPFVTVLSPTLDDAISSAVLSAYRGAK
jgi:DNA-binding cell septation regulator SpoVG